MQICIRSKLTIYTGMIEDTFVSNLGAKVFRLTSMNIEYPNWDIWEKGFYWGFVRKRLVYGAE